MKKYRMLIAAAIALVLIVAAYFIVINVIPEPEVKPVEKAPTFNLVDYQTTQIDRVDFTMQNGYTYAILGQNVQNSVGGTSRNYIIENKSQYNFDRATIGTALMTITDINVGSILDENPSDLVVYGFDDPTVTVTITPYAEYGEPVTIILGDPTPVGDSYYAKVDGKPEVYVLSNYITKYMTATDAYYRDLSITAYTDAYSEIATVKVTKNGEPVIGVAKKSAEEIKATGFGATTVLTAPIEYDANDTLVQEFYEKFLEISAISVIEDSTENAEKYGLTENTTVIEIGNEDGTNKKITLSQPDASGYRYGIVAGINSILLFNASDFTFLDVNYKDYMYSLLWLHDINKVARVDMMLDGKSYVMEFTFETIPATEEGKEDTVVLHPTLDGEPIVESNGRRLYIKVLSPNMYDFVGEEQKPGEIKYSLKITYQTGEEYTLDLARLNERQYAAILNGENTGFYVNVNDLHDLEKAVLKVKDGHTLSMSE